MAHVYKFLALGGLAALALLMTPSDPSEAALTDDWRVPVQSHTGQGATIKPDKEASVSRRSPLPTPTDSSYVPDEAPQQSVPHRTVQTIAPREPAAPRRVRVSPSSPNIRKCVNLGGALDAPIEGTWGYTIRAHDLALIKRSGFDTVRLPVQWTAHTESRAPYAIDPALLARTDDVIREALSLNLKVILDVHNYTAFTDNPEAEMPRLKSIWSQLSSHYASWPDGLVFEVLNEANNNVTVAKSNRINTELLRIIRKTNPRRWVVLGSGNWGSLDPFLAGASEKFVAPRDPRIIATFHYYDDFNFTHQGAYFLDKPPPTGKRFGTRADKADIAKHMAQARAFQDRTGIPMFMGEFGVYNGVSLSQRTAWTKTVRTAAEAQGLGWCHWDWATTFNMFDKDTGNFLPGYQAALFK